MTDWTDLELRLTPERSAQLRAGLLTEVTRTPARSRHRFAGIVITAAATLTVAGTAAAWVSMTQPDDPNEGCCGLVACPKPTPGSVDAARGPRPSLLARAVVQAVISAAASAGNPAATRPLVPAGPGMVISDPATSAGAENPAWSRTHPAPALSAGCTSIKRPPRCGA